MPVLAAKIGPFAPAIFGTALPTMPVRPTDTSGSAVAGPIRRGAVAVITQGDRLLVIRRSQRVSAPGAYCFPGGGIESGEDEQQAVIRELREELCADVRPYRRMWECVTPWGVHLAWWRCELLAETLVACEAEVASFHWFSPVELAELPGLLESNHGFLRELAQGRISL